MKFEDSILLFIKTFNCKLFMNLAINLLKIQGAQVAEVQGARGVFIPINNDAIFEGKDGAAYLSALVVESKPNSYGYVFSLKRKNGNKWDFIGNIKNTSKQQEP